MGTELMEHPMMIKRFYGGRDRGICYALHISKELTKQEFIDLITQINEIVKKESQMPWW